MSSNKQTKHRRVILSDERIREADDRGVEGPPISPTNCASHYASICHPDRGLQPAREQLPPTFVIPTEGSIVRSFSSGRRSRPSGGTCFSTAPACSAPGDHASAVGAKNLSPALQRWEGNQQMRRVPRGRHRIPRHSLILLPCLRHSCPKQNASPALKRWAMIFRPAQRDSVPLPVPPHAQHSQMQGRCFHPEC